MSNQIIRFEYNDISSFFSAPSTFQELMENLIEEIEPELKDNEELIIIDENNNRIKNEEDYNILKKKPGDIKLIVQKGAINNKKLIKNNKEEERKKKIVNQNIDKNDNNDNDNNNNNDNDNDNNNDNDNDNFHILKDDNNNITSKDDNNNITSKDDINNINENGSKKEAINEIYSKELLDKIKELLEAKLKPINEKIENDKLERVKKFREMNEKLSKLEKTFNQNLEIIKSELVDNEKSKQEMMNSINRISQNLNNNINKIKEELIPKQFQLLETKINKSQDDLSKFIKEIKDVLNDKKEIKEVLNDKKEKKYDGNKRDLLNSNNKLENNNNIRNYQAKINISINKNPIQIKNLKENNENINCQIQNFGKTSLPSSCYIEGKGENLFIQSQKINKTIPVNGSISLNLNLNIKTNKTPSGQEAIRIYLYDPNNNLITSIEFYLEIEKKLERIDSARSIFDMDFDENLNKLKNFFGDKSVDELMIALNQANGNYEDAIQILLDN